MLNRHGTNGGRFVGFSTLALVLSLGAASPLWAAELTGSNGTPGTDGDPVDTQAGGDGGHGGSATLTGTNAANKATGGSGGKGGAGAPPGIGGDGGDAEAEASETAEAYGGNGGSGGNNFASSGGVHGNAGYAGSAEATADYTGTGDNTINATAEGGIGGASSGQGDSGTARSGGFATAEATGVATDAAGNLHVTANAEGGRGGAGLTSGSGGSATASASGQSDYGGGVVVKVVQTGGNGELGSVNIDYSSSSFVGGQGGNGAHSAILSNQIDGYSQGGAVTLEMVATGGDAGPGSTFDDGGTNTTPAGAGSAGDASATMNKTSTHSETSFSGETTAIGGAGGYAGSSENATSGGHATASTIMEATGSSTAVSSEATATGGEGGSHQLYFDLVGANAGFGGQADAEAEAISINGNATARATAEGGNGGTVTAGYGGAAGVGGDANAEAIATSVSGVAYAKAVADAGDGGGSGLGGLATAEAFASTGGLSFSVFDTASDGGTAIAEADLSAPVGGAGTIPTLPGGDTVGQIIIDSLTDTTVSYTGTLTMGRTGGALIRAANADHTISATTGIVFSTDITVDVVDATDSLTLTKSPVLSSGIELTKSGAGSLRLDQDFDLDSNKLIVKMESGTFSSTEPQIYVDGDLDIGDVLDLDLVGAFEPSIGDEFDIFEYTGSLTGVFDAVEFPSVDGITFGIEYNSGVITLDVVLEGDLNDDGFVGQTDLNIVLGNFNDNVDAGVLLQGDLSGDGFVGSADLNTVLGNWNAGTPPVASAAIPEPASLALFGLSGLVVLRRRKV